MKHVLICMAVVCIALSACGGKATPDPTVVARLVAQAVKATVVAMPTPEPQTIEVEKIVRETAIVEKPVRETVIVEKVIVATPTLEPSPTSTFATNWSTAQVIEAFKAAGLEAEDVRPMTKDDYGLAPMVAVEATRFLIPSLCEECGGRVFSFTSQADLDSMLDYYASWGEASALFYSWLFVRDSILVQINGSLPEEAARQYGAALVEVPVVEEGIIVTPTPKPPTPMAELTIADVVPADARASAFVSGNASPELPAGELGGVAIIALGQFAGKSSVRFVARNNTTEAIGRIEVSAVACTADGSMFAVGEGNAYDPNVIGPGEIVFGHVYFGAAELLSDVTIEFDVSYELVKEGRFENIRDLEILEFELIENRIVGMLQNPHDEAITFPIGVQVHCFDEQGSVLSTYQDYTPKDEMEPKGTIPYQVDLRGECPTYLITARGFSY